MDPRKHLEREQSKVTHIPKEFLSYLHKEIKRNNQEYISQTIKKNPQFKEEASKPYKGHTALSLAIILGHTEITKLLIQSKVSLDKHSLGTRGYPETPLISAMRIGSHQILKYLIKYKANVGIIGFFDKTPLWFATKEQNLSYVKALLSAGAPINFTEAAQNPINLAIHFLNHKIKESTHMGEIVLSAEAYTRITIIERKENISNLRSIVIELLAAGLPLSLRDAKELSPLSWTTIYKDSKLFTLLIEAGVRPKRRLWLDTQNLPTEWKDTTMPNFIEKEQTNPPPLIRLVRTIIRKSLRLSTNKDIRLTIDKLRIPLPLKHFIMMNKEIANAKISHRPERF